jgi:hypothetical protein
MALSGRRWWGKISLAPLRASEHSFTSKPPSEASLFRQEKRMMPTDSSFTPEHRIYLSCSSMEDTLTIYVYCSCQPHPRGVYPEALATFTTLTGGVALEKILAVVARHTNPGGYK